MGKREMKENNDVLAWWEKWFNVRKVTDQSIKRICWILVSHGKIFSLIMWSRPWCTCLWECRRLCAGNAQPWACVCSGIHILLPHGLRPHQALQKGLELQYQHFLAANVALKQPWVPWNCWVFPLDPTQAQWGLRMGNFDSLLCFLSDHGHLPYTPGTPHPLRFQ